jgi:hypothetical protein
MRKSNVLIACFFLLSIALACGRKAAPSPTSTSQPGAALPAVMTPQRTATLPPSATPQATATTMAGWKKFEGGGVALSLPESWIGGDLSKDLDMIIGKIRALGPNYEQGARLIEQNRSVFLMYVLDPKVGDSGFLTNMNVVTEQVLSAITIDTYLDAAIKQLPGEFSVRERGTVSLGPQQAGRVVLEATMMGQRVKELMYVIKSDSVVRIVTYATGAGEFERRLPVFEQSIRTFSIQR